MFRLVPIAPCLIAFALNLFEAAPSLAQEPPTNSVSYQIPGTEVFTMTADNSGEAYRIFVSKPEQPAPNGGFPVLYVLDGNAFFAGFAGERRLEEFGKQAGGSVIIVGVGYPTDQPYDMLRRLYDFTPAWPVEMPANQISMQDLKAGGNENFAQFLLGQLRTEIIKRYPVAPDRQSLFGHSLGGLFALHILYSRPNAFEAIIAASPSQWWNDQEILLEERAFSEQLIKGNISAGVSRLLLLTGEQDKAATITWDAEALLGRLSPLSAYGLRTRFEKFEKETHITVPYRAITPTIRFVSGLP
ncbi:alpha/beta hydrolase [Kordiimonas pumila]|uniref:Alpha/beta hydrolase n=1 Tax=Kordiimonas pumila TaxID=2161677 RepID=A0ABV7D503_9PROT|nr:alpha/beta hydrolase-fold protein [Kordiimonas pumila]